MMQNSDIQKEAIKKIATALGNLNEQVVYVGGAVVSLYSDDPAADDVRPTKDIDISVSIASISELEELRQQLHIRGFRQTADDDVICRFRYDGIKVDVMSTTPVGWAPANPWFAPGFKTRLEINLEGQKISILPVAYFLASKFVAFNDRGASDPRMSHDFEDIVYILDNTATISSQVFDSPGDVRTYLKEEFTSILGDDVKQEAIQGNLFYHNREQRFQKILAKLQEMCKTI